MPQAYFIPLHAVSEMPSASQLLAELHSAAFGVLHYGPSHNLLRPAYCGTRILRAPSPYPCPGVDRSASGCCPPGLQCRGDGYNFRPAAISHQPGWVISHDETETGRSDGSLSKKWEATIT